MSHELEQRLVKCDGGIVAKQTYIEPVVDHIVAQPYWHVTVDLRRELAICLPKGLEFQKSVGWIGYTDTIEQLIQIDKGKR